MYQTGLRLTETLRVQPKDIDGKNREVPISAELLVRLRNSWAYQRNPNWLFPAVGRGWKSSGTFTALPATIEAIYQPSIRAHTESRVMTINKLKK